MRVRREVVPDFGGAIPTGFGQLVPKRIDAIRKVDHEGRRLLALCPSELLAALLASNSLAGELIQHRLDFSLAMGVHIDCFFVIISGSAYS